jgi:hypothetical protein
MSTSESTASVEAGFITRLRAATELLESIIADRGLLARASTEERQRLLQAVGKVYNPDHIARRRLVKAMTRQRKADLADRD